MNLEMLVGGQCPLMSSVERILNGDTRKAIQNQSLLLVKKIV